MIAKFITFFLLAGFFGLVGCRKEQSKMAEVSSDQLLLSKRIINGSLQEEFIYGLDKKLLRHDSYNIINNQSYFSRYTQYDYNASQRVSQVKMFSNDDTLNNTIIVKYAGNGKISGTDHIHAGSMVQQTSFNYNTLQQLIRISEISPSTGQVTAYTDYTYDDGGRINSSKRYHKSLNQFKLGTEIYFENDVNMNLYAHWNKFRLFPHDMAVIEIMYKSMHVIDYDAAGSVFMDYTMTATEKIYNEAGYVVRKKVNVEYLQPANPDQERVIDYVYVK